MTVAIISLLLSVVAILISVRAFFCTKRQTAIMEREEARKQADDRTTREWAPRFYEAVRKVVSLAPRMPVSELRVLMNGEAA